MRMYLATVDMDCDGASTAIWRVNLPAGLEDADACRRAVELGQIDHLYPNDPSEWFTIAPGTLAFHIAEQAFVKIDAMRGRHSTLKHYASMSGNIFARSNRAITA